MRHDQGIQNSFAGLEYEHRIKHSAALAPPTVTKSKRSISANNAGSADNAGHVIVVLGMHRSGTSVVTRALNALGVSLGEDLHPARPDNPTGYWEDRECIEINDQLLDHLGSALDRLELPTPLPPPDDVINALSARAVGLVRQRLAEGGGCWGFKDPRTCRLLDFWRPTFQAANCSTSFVLAIRNPKNVALSLERRQQMAAEKSYLLWLQHVVPAASATIGSPRRVVIDYEQMMRDPLRELGRMAAALNLTMDPDSPEISTFIDGFLDEQLWRNRSSASELVEEPAAHAVVPGVYEKLLLIAKDQLPIDAPSVKAVLADAKALLANLRPAISYLDKVETERDALVSAAQRHTQQLADVEHAEYLTRQQLDIERGRAEIAELRATQHWDRAEAEHARVNAAEQHNASLREREEVLTWEISVQREAAASLRLQMKAEADRANAAEQRIAEARAVAEASEAQIAKECDRADAAEQTANALRIKVSTADHSANVERERASAAERQAEVERQRADAAERQVEDERERATLARYQATASQARAAAAEQEAASQRSRALAAETHAAAERTRAEAAENQAQALRSRADTAEQRLASSNAWGEAAERRAVIQQERAQAAERQIAVTRDRAESAESRAAAERERSDAALGLAKTQQFQIASLTEQLTGQRDRAISAEKRLNDQRARAENLAKYLTAQAGKVLTLERLAAEHRERAEIAESEAASLYQRAEVAETEAAALRERVTAAEQYGGDQLQRAEAAEIEIAFQQARAESADLNAADLLQRAEAAEREAVAQFDRAEKLDAEVVAQRDLAMAASTAANEHLAKLELVESQLRGAMTRIGILEAPKGWRPVRPPRPLVRTWASIVAMRLQRLPVPLKRTNVRVEARLGDEARNRADWPAAIVHYRKYLRARPNDFAIWVQLGHALKEAGLPDEAFGAYGQAVHINGRDSDLLLSLGHLHKSMGHGERAASFYRRSAAEDPTSPAVAELHNLGVSPDMYD